VQQGPWSVAASAEVRFLGRPDDESESVLWDYDIVADGKFTPAVILQRVEAKLKQL
jgi:hypothetical protein